MRNLYEKCFDLDGSVKVCGRDSCKALIQACQEFQPGVDFGNADTGMMNVQNINQLMKSMNDGE